MGRKRKSIGAVEGLSGKGDELGRVRRGTVLGGGAALLWREDRAGGFETHWDGTVREGIIYNGTKEELQEYIQAADMKLWKEGTDAGWRLYH